MKNFVTDYAKQNNICLDHNWAVLASAAAGIAMFMIGRRGRKQNTLMAAFGAISTATATYAALNCVSQQKIKEVAHEVKDEAKEVLSDSPKTTNGFPARNPALSGQGN